MRQVKDRPARRSGSNHTIVAPYKRPSFTRPGGRMPPPARAEVQTPVGPAPGRIVRGGRARSAPPAAVWVWRRDARSTPPGVPAVHTLGSKALGKPPHKEPCRHSRRHKRRLARRASTRVGDNQPHPHSPNHHDPDKNMVADRWRTQLAATPPSPSAVVVQAWSSRIDFLRGRTPPHMRGKLLQSGIGRSQSQSPQKPARFAQSTQSNPLLRGGILVASPSGFVDFLSRYGYAERGEPQPWEAP